MSATFQRGNSRQVMLPVASADAYAQGDLVGRNSTTGVGFRAGSQAWDTDLATTRAAFVVLFAGVSAQDKDADENVYGNGEANKLNLRIDTGGVHLFDCATGTYKLGDYLGPAKQSGNALENQKLEIVATEAQATHKCVGVRGSFTDPTEVEAEVLSRVFRGASAT